MLHYIALLITCLQHLSIFSSFASRPIAQFTADGPGVATQHSGRRWWRRRAGSASQRSNRCRWWAADDRGGPFAEPRDTLLIGSAPAS
uniref:Putative secreted protein n=1 Tax=Anopheles marajoara TaxID=58244 RepID=A0A2M4CAH9_9DIPT